MKTYTHKKITSREILFFILSGILLQISFLIFTPLTVYGSNYSEHAGFREWRAEEIGPTSVCPAGQAQYGFKFTEYQSTQEIAPADLHNIWAVPYVWDGSGYSYSPVATEGWGWFDLTKGVYPYVCADPNHWVGIRIEGYNKSDYKGTLSQSNRASSSVYRIREVGRHYVQYVELQPKSQSQDTVAPIFPVREAINYDPSFVTELFHMPNTFGATKVYEGDYFTSNWDTGVYAWSPVYSLDGTIGQYTLPNSNLADGYYNYFSILYFNGEYHPAVISPDYYIDIPMTTYKDSQTQFIIDRIKPDTSLVATVTGSDATTLTLSLENTVFDSNSGLKNTKIIVENLDNGAKTISTQNFSLIAGEFFGPWEDPILVSVNATVSKTTNYSIYAVTEDVAGNISTSTATYFYAEPTASLTASPLSVYTGSSTNLTWSSTNADSCTASNDGGAAWTGAKSTSGGPTPITVTTDTTFTLVCTNAYGTGTSTADVTTAPPPSAAPDPSANFTASPLVIRYGETTTLSWELIDNTYFTDCKLINADSSDVLIDNSVDNTGSYESRPLTNSTTITLSCTYDGVPYEENVYVQVLPRMQES